MAASAKPTNLRVTEMLERILRELGELKKTQDQLAADLRTIAQQRTPS